MAGSSTTRLCITIHLSSEVRLSHERNDLRANPHIILAYLRIPGLGFFTIPPSSAFLHGDVFGYESWFSWT